MKFENIEMSDVSDKSLYTLINGLIKDHGGHEKMIPTVYNRFLELGIGEL